MTERLMKTYHVAVHHLTTRREKMIRLRVRHPVRNNFVIIVCLCCDVVVCRVVDRCPLCEGVLLFRMRVPVCGLLLCINLSMFVDPILKRLINMRRDK